MPLKINTDHPDFKAIKSEHDWRQLVRAYQSGGDDGLDQMWEQLYGPTESEPAKTTKPPVGVK